MENDLNRMDPAGCMPCMQFIISTYYAHLTLLSFKYLIKLVCNNKYFKLVNSIKSFRLKKITLKVCFEKITLNDIYESL